MGKKGLYWACALLAVAIVVVAVMWVAGGRCRIEGDNPADRIRSISRLGGEKSRGAGEVIARAAVSEGDPSVRQAALVALARFAEPEYRGAVEQATRDASAEVRAAAAVSLGRYEDTAAADRLGEMANTDPNPKVRIGAVLGLGCNKSSRATAWLVRSAEDNRNADVQFRAISELCEKFGTHYIGAEPSQVKDWAREAAGVVEFLKYHPKVAEAYRDASWPLNRRPEYYQDRHEAQLPVPSAN